MSEQATIKDRAREALAAKDVDLDTLADLPTNVDRAKEFARRGIAVAPGQYRPDDRICSCGNLSCPTPGGHLISRHLLSDPWELRHSDNDRIEHAWQAHPLASVGFKLRLEGEKYDRRFIYDGAAIREAIQIQRIR